MVLLRRRRGMHAMNSGNELGFLRALLVASSLSPVFLLWAVRGVKAIEGPLWWGSCLLLFAIPNLALLWLVRRARNRRIVQTIAVSSYTDRREHLITYLMALLIPLYDANIGDTRELVAAFLALLLVAFLFWYMRLHYINVVFAVFGYRLYEVTLMRTTTEGGAVSSMAALISRKAALQVNVPFAAVHLGGAVLLDSDD